MVMGVMCNYARTLFNSVCGLVLGAFAPLAVTALILKSRLAHASQPRGDFEGFGDYQVDGIIILFGSVLAVTGALIGLLCAICRTEVEVDSESNHEFAPNYGNRQKNGMTEK
jgi:hypothetical protein